MAIIPENILFTGSVLLLVSIIAGKTTDRLGVPTLIFFLIVGILAGSEGIGGIQFENYHLAELIGIVSLNFILFSGGLDTNWQSIKPILWRGVSLSTIGVFVTALSVGLFVYFILDFSLLEGLLLGAIVSATDAAAVFSILRNQGIGLKGNLRPVLELESDASFEDVKTAWRRLAKANHPDARPDDAEAAERFRSVQAAWDVLRQAEERRAA